MFEHKARVLLSLSQEVLDRVRVIAGKATTALKLPVSLQIVLRALIGEGLTGRSLLESPPTQARSLKGRPLGMGSSLMLPELSRLRLLEPGSRFVTALGEQRRPMTGLNELREQGKMTWIDRSTDGSRRRKS